MTEVDIFELKFQFKKLVNMTEVDIFELQFQFKNDRNRYF